MNPLKFILNFLYPNYCQNCDKLLKNYDPHCFCSECWSEIKIIKTPTCKKCGKPIITSSGICNDCKNSKFYYNEIKVLGLYEGILKDAIHLYKFNGRFKISYDFASLIFNNIEKEYFLDCDLIIPVPLTKNRLLERGFSQTYLVSKYLGKFYNLPVYKNVLLKIKDTIPQSLLTREERLKSLINCFAINKNLKNIILNKKILLFDDIFTTGSTVNECSKVLKENGASYIKVFTIARGV